MPHQVTVQSGQSNVQLPNGGHYDAGDVVVLTDAEFDQLDPDVFTSVLTDNGEVDANDLVSVQAAVVAAPAALTSAAATGGDAPTEAEYNALRTDVVNLRTSLANTLTALKGTGKPMHP